MQTGGGSVAEIVSYLRELNMVSMMVRLLLAVITGGIVGIERERRNRPAGFRTYILVAIGAAITMLLSQYLDAMLSGPWADTAAQVGIKTDVSRFGAQVINGVGFLGAGTVIVTSRQQVKGLTTAAGLWASACMGLAIGAGFYEGVLVGFVLIWASMRFFPKIEDAAMARARNMNVFVEMESMENLGPLISCMKAEGMVIYDVELGRDPEIDYRSTSAVISFGLAARRAHTEVLALLSSVAGVRTIEEV